MSATAAPPHAFIRAIDGPPGRPCWICGQSYEGFHIVGDDRIEPRRFVECRVQADDPVVPAAVLISERDEPGRTVRMHRDPMSGAAQAVTVEEHPVICSECVAAAALQFGMPVTVDYTLEAEHERAERAERRAAEAESALELAERGYQTVRALHQLFELERGTDKKPSTRGGKGS
jgi:hypothetical protein